MPSVDKDLLMAIYVPNNVKFLIEFRHHITLSLAKKCLVDDGKLWNSLCAWLHNYIMSARYIHIWLLLQGGKIVCKSIFEACPKLRCDRSQLLWDKNDCCPKCPIGKIYSFINYLNLLNCFVIADPNQPHEQGMPSMKLVHYLMVIFLLL